MKSSRRSGQRAGGPHRLQTRIGPQGGGQLPPGEASWRLVPITRSATERRARWTQQGKQDSAALSAFLLSFCFTPWDEWCANAGAEGDARGTRARASRAEESAKAGGKKWRGAAQRSAHLQGRLVRWPQSGTARSRRNELSEVTGRSQHARAALSPQSSFNTHTPIRCTALFTKGAYPHGDCAPQSQWANPPH